MNREQMVSQLNSQGEWDVIIIGGGATGLGSAVESAARGYKTLLLEQADFAKGTSSRSTKLVHGGVRYLKQGNVSLVIEALRERGLLCQNAPHLVRHLSFVVPRYDWWEGPFYGIGLKLYDILAGRMGLGPSKWLSKDKTIECLPTVEPKGLRGGVIYFDAQFDDARLAINLAQTAAENGCTLVNYAAVTGLIKDDTDGLVRGVKIKDRLSDTILSLKAKVVINATGVFSDSVRKMDDIEAPDIIMPSQGVHIILDKRFLPGNSAIMVPETDDGRVLFAIPWHDRVVVGTTDTAVPKAELEPKPLKEEIDFLLVHASRYLNTTVTEKDVLSMFAGLRPLVSMGKGQKSSSISRDHTLMISRSGLVTITGGKWTTYRRMAEDCIDKASAVGGLEEQPSVTKNLHIHGWMENVSSEANTFDGLDIYGSDGPAIQKLKDQDASLAKAIHEQLPYSCAEVVWAVQNEMAMTVDDVLSRRTRALLLNARAAMEAAPLVANLMAKVMGRSLAWETTQVEQFRAIAKNYCLEDDWRESMKSVESLIDS